MNDRMSAADYRALMGISTTRAPGTERMSAAAFQASLSSQQEPTPTGDKRSFRRPSPDGQKKGLKTPQERLNTPTHTSAPPNSKKTRQRVSDGSNLTPQETASMPVRRKFRAQPEFDEQCALFSWARDPLARKIYPGLRLLSSSLNGVKLTKAQAGKAKAAGMLTGESDVRLPVPRGRWIGLIIEMKAGKNTATDEQLAYGKEMEAEGHRFRICYSATAAQEIIIEYLSLPRPKIVCVAP